MFKRVRPCRPCSFCAQTTPISSSIIAFGRLNDCAFRLETVVLSLGAVILTGLFAIAAPIMQERLRARREAASDQAARRRRALELAVGLQAVVEQTKPSDYAVNTSKQHYESQADLMDKLAEARVPLVTLAAESGDDSLLIDVRETLRAARNGVYATGLVVQEMAGGGLPSHQLLTAAEERQTQAVEKADALIDHLRTTPSL